MCHLFIALRLSTNSFEFHGFALFQVRFIALGTGLLQGFHGCFSYQKYFTKVTNRYNEMGYQSQSARPRYVATKLMI